MHVIEESRVTEPFGYNQPVEGLSAGMSYSERGWRLLIVLLSVLLAYVPLILSRSYLTDGGISRNDTVVFVVAPAAVLALMLTSLVMGARFSPVCPLFGLRWFSERKHVDVIGGVALAGVVLVFDGILRNVLGYSYAAGRVMLSRPLSGVVLAIYVTQLAVAAPFIEEIFWRGYVQGVLQTTLTKRTALVLQAVLFALLHLRGPEETMAIFGIGLIHGIWRHRRRTLIPLIIAHVIVNSVACVAFVRDHLDWQKVKIARDYSLSLEQLCTPAGYSPNEDARFHYDRAFRTVRGRPEGLVSADLNAQPGQLSGDKVQALRDWIHINEEAMAQFVAGTNASYYTREYSRLSFDDIVAPPHEQEAGTLIALLLSRARMNMVEGDFQKCLSDIMACCRFARHLTGPKPLNEQAFGIEIYSSALDTAWAALSASCDDGHRLKVLQDGFEELFRDGVLRTDFRGQQLVCYDIIQMSFTDDGVGGGRIPLALVRDLMKDPHYSRYGEKAWRMLNRRETSRLTDRVFAYLNSVSGLTPAELRQKGESVQDVIQQITGDNVLLQTQIGGLTRYYYGTYRVKARVGGVIVAGAVMRYREEQGNLPDSLDSLVREGYIDVVPVDPFSGAYFAYRKLGADFLLYSLGPDFKDDGGARLSRNAAMGDGDEVFWPLANRSY